jgi:hypothetical protein
MSTATFSTSWTPPAAGTFNWIAVYAGDANNKPFTTKCGDPNEEIAIAPASPTVTTQASPTGGMVGFPITVGDTATLHSASPAPGGTVTFTLYSDSACMMAVSGVSGSGNVSTSSGTSTASYSTTWTPPAAGTYYWVASYSGDGNNKAAVTKCGDPNEEITITTSAQTQLTPTQTTCNQFVAGQASNIGPLAYGVKSGAINSVSPGVFFDYTSFQAPAAGTFTASISESNNGPKQTNGAAWPNITALNGQVVLYTSSCAVVKNAVVTTTNNNGVLTYTVSVKATAANQGFVIGIKYNPPSIDGTKVGNTTPTVTYTFKTTLNMGTALTSSSETLAVR